MIAIPRGYRREHLVVDWGCPTCRRVILAAVTLKNSVAGIRDNICTDCYKAEQEAGRRTEHLLDLTQVEDYASLYRGSVCAIRDDIAHHLRGLTTPRRLVRLYRDLKLQLPRQIIPQHDPEF